jgi:hypothetical protein
MSVSDLVFGPARFFYAPLGEPLPAESLAYGAPWTGNWVEVGLTLQPVSLSREVDVNEVMAEKSRKPLARKVEAERVAIETTLAELSASNLHLAFGGVKNVTPPGIGQVGKEELLAGGSARLTERTWAVEGMYATLCNTRGPVRLQIWRGTAVLNGPITFSSRAAAGIPLRIDALGDLARPVGQQAFMVQRIGPWPCAHIPTDTTVTIPANEEMIVCGCLMVDGLLVVDGKLIVL